MPSTPRLSTVNAMHAFVLSLLAASTLAHASPAPQMPHASLHKRAISYVGCFSSSAPLTEANTWMYQTSGYCQQHSNNAAVIGLSNGNQCWTGSQYPAESDKVDDSKCSTVCDGFGSEQCGANGFWTVYDTGVESNVGYYSGGSSSSSTSSSSEATTSTQASTSTSSAAPSVVTSVVQGGATVIVTQTPTAIASASASASGSSKGSKGNGGSGSSNTAGIAAGVVVGVVALAAIIAGLFFFIRHKKKQQAEEEYRQRNQVSDFMRGANERKPPGTGYSGMSDQRLDPGSGRRNSVGSLADEQDYSRRILRVANPDSS